MCSCSKELSFTDNIKLILKSAINDNVKEDLILEETLKEEMLDYLESMKDFGISFKELGITEDLLNNSKYYHELDESDFNLDEDKESFINSDIRYLYKYFSNEYGESGTGSNSRRFCKVLVSRTKFNLLTRKDISNLNSVNTGFGKGGSNTYSVFNWRGGVNCKHKWVKFVYNQRHLTIEEALTSQQPIQTTDSKGGVPGMPKKNKK